MLLICFGWIINAQASSPYCGHITYKHIADYSYEITITEYIDASSPSENPFVSVNWGDGSSIESVYRTNDEILDGNIRKNVFVETHDFIEAGNYVISISEPNRNAGILNINYGNSLEVEFYIETELIISSAESHNNSAEFLTTFVLDASSSQPFQTNLSSLDADGDILSYELVAPNGIIDAQPSEYYIPEGLSVNSESGELTWESPEVGDYVFAVKITECRDGEKVGSVIVDIQLSVSNNGSTDTGFIEMEDWPVDSDNNYVLTVTPNQLVNLGMAYTNSGDSDPVVLIGYGEPFLNGNGATYPPGTMTVDYIHRNFNWNPTNAHVRCAPYLVTFRGYLFMSDATEIEDVSLLIYVHDDTMENCNAACSDLVSAVNENEFAEIEMTVYPNPFNTQTTISISNLEAVSVDQLQIYDLSGRVVQSIAVLNQSEINIQREGLDAGVYLYSLLNASRTVAVGKIVITD